MEKINETQALLVLKNMIDTAIKKGGIFKNAEEVVNVINSYNVVAQIVEKQING